MQSFLHSEAWQAFQEAAGATTHRYLDQLYLKRSIPRGSYWQCSRCTIPEEFTLPEIARTTDFLRFEPLTEADLLSLQSTASQTHRKLEKTISVQPKQTLLLNLDQTEEQILQGMKQKHRYNIKQAEKHGVAVDIISQNPSQSFERIWNLLSTTAARQGFRLHHREYYQVMLQSLEKSGNIHLLFARIGEEDLAGMILVTYQGTATYLHGGSTDSHKEAMAPYLLHWKAIQLAKSLGNQMYDFWGSDLIQNSEGQWEPKKNHPSAGTSRFKLGFGGQVVNYPGAYDLILNPFCYTLYKTLRAIRGLRSKRAFS